MTAKVHTIGQRPVEEQLMNISAIQPLMRYHFVFDDRFKKPSHQ